MEIILQFGKKVFPEQIIYSIIIMIILAIVGILIGRAFKRADYRKPQGLFLSFIDTGAEGLTNFFGENLGSDNIGWVTTLITMFVYLIFCNTAGLWGIHAPSTSLSFTASFAMWTFVVYNYVGFKSMKLGYFKQFTGPIPSIGFKILLTPIEVLSHLARPVTLAMRMYGNILAGTVIIELVIDLFKHFNIWGLSFILLSPVLSPFFDIVDAGLQAFVFILLTAIYIKEARASH